jgi:hypothetical protein
VALGVAAALDGVGVVLALGVDGGGVADDPGTRLGLELDAGPAQAATSQAMAMIAVGTRLAKRVRRLSMVAPNDVFERTDAVSGSRDGVIERRACFLRRY